MVNSKAKNYIHSLLWITFVIGSLTFVYFVPPNVAYYPVPRDADEFMVEMIKVGMESRIIADAKGKILYASQTASEITEYEPSEIKNSNINILIPDRYIQRHDIKFKEALKRHDGKIVSIRCYLKTKSKGEIPVEIRTRVMNTKFGEVILVTLTRLEQLVEDNGNKL